MWQLFASAVNGGDLGWGLAAALTLFAMALNARTRVITRNTALDAFDALNAGFLNIYDGAQPTNADTALGAQVLLAQLTLNATFAPAASAAAKTANAIGSDTSANASGTATWGSLTTSGGTRVLDFEVGTSGANMNLNSVAISAGATVSCSSFVITQAVQ